VRKIIERKTRGWFASPIEENSISMGLEKEGLMNELGFAACDQAFSFECSGEVTNLIRTAERYGVLIEKARVRIEAICRQCKNFSRLGRSRSESEGN
jgi:hypothetical protein